MSRKVCITAVDGQTGFLIGELILTKKEFSRKLDSVVGLSLNPDSNRAQELKGLGATIVPHIPGRVREMVKNLKQTGCDTICLVPPAHEDKFDICMELVEAAKKAEVPNVLLISAAGCDYADPPEAAAAEGVHRHRERGAGGQGRCQHADGNVALRDQSWILCREFTAVLEAG